MIADINSLRKPFITDFVMIKVATLTAIAKIEIETVIFGKNRNFLEDK
jgi:hypothetical protein